MPFDSSGVYTPPLGAENAAPGEVIRSAIWNTIFTDISTALTELAQGTFIPAPKVLNTAGASYTVAPADTVILVEANTPTITLPLSATKTGEARIMGANATVFGSFNTVVVFTGGETASGIPSFTLNTNYQILALYPLPSGGYIFDS